MQNNQTIKFIMITNDAIIIYICCCALFLKEMLMCVLCVGLPFFYLLNTKWNANVQLVMNSFGTIFPDNSFSMTFP